MNKVLYPTQAYLTQLLQIWVTLKWCNDTKLLLDLEHVTPIYRLQLLRELPLYCTKATFRRSNLTDLDKTFLAIFREKNIEHQAEVDAVLRIILDQESYIKTAFNESKLANVLSRFFWAVKSTLPQDVFDIIERTFYIEYSYPKSGQQYLTDYFNETISKLPANSYPITSTGIDIRNQIKKNSFEGKSQAHILISSLEKHIRKKNDLIHNEHIPIAESLFYLANSGSIQLQKIEDEMLTITAIPNSSQYPWYDEDNKTLYLDEDATYTIGKSEADEHLLHFLFYGEKQLGEEWSYSELQEVWEIDREASKLLDREKGVKRFFTRAVDGLIKRVNESAKISTFIKKRPRHFRINIDS